MQRSNQKELSYVEIFTIAFLVGLGATTLVASVARAETAGGVASAIPTRINTSQEKVEGKSLAAEQNAATLENVVADDRSDDEKETVRRPFHFSGRLENLD